MGNWNETKLVQGYKGSQIVLKITIMFAKLALPLLIWQTVFNICPYFLYSHLHDIQPLLSSSSAREEKFLCSCIRKKRARSFVVDSTNKAEKVSQTLIMFQHVFFAARSSIPTLCHQIFSPVSFFVLQYYNLCIRVIFIIP